MRDQMLLFIASIAAVFAAGCGRTPLNFLDRAGNGEIDAAGIGGVPGLYPSGGTGGLSAAGGRDGGHSGGGGATLATSGSGGTTASGTASGGARGGGGGISTGPSGGLVTLAEGQAKPLALALDSINAYWADTGTSVRGSIMMVPLAGGTATLQSGAVAANGLATYDGNVYWTGLQTGGIPSVMMMPVAGNGWNVLASGFANAAIAVGPKGVYGTGPVAGGTTILSAPLAGGTATSLVPPEDLPQPFASNGMAVDATSLYWTSASDPCTVMKVALDGGSPIKLGTAPGGGFGIAVDASNVYWVTTQAVTKVPVAGGDAVTLAATGGWGIAVDATSVYWTDFRNPGSVSRVPILGGTPTILATGLQYPAGIAIDATSVYWTNEGDGDRNGSLMKLTPK